MATCIGCSRKTCDLPIPRDLNAIYNQGDVYGLKESVYTPIYDILRRRASNPVGDSDALTRSRQSFSSITSVTDVIEDARPAIIMQKEMNCRRGPLVCLATTYSKKDISELPRIFRHFSVPIAPHNHISPGHVDHLHSLPEWEKEDAWIIAWQFRSRATRKGPWIAHVDGERVPYVFGADAMGFLRTESSKRWDKWQEMCKDPVLAAELEAELTDHIEQRNVEKRQKRFYGGGARSRASSCESVATVNSASWRSRVCSPTTIPEEPENNVVPGAPGKPHEPRPQKFTRKPRTGSTYSFASASGKTADADKNSIKSTRSRTSLAQKPQSGGGFLNKFGVNKFDVLRTLKVNAG